MLFWEKSVVLGSRDVHRRKLVVFLFILLITGFVITSIVYFFAARSTIDDEILTNELPLTADCIKYSLKANMALPSMVTTEMADNPEIKKMLDDDKKNIGKIVRYLDLIRLKNKLLSCSLSSGASGRRYCSGGSAGKVFGSIDSSLCMKLKKLAGTSISVLKLDHSERPVTTLVSCRKIFDDGGNIIGIAEAEYSLNTVLKALEKYQRKFNREVFLFGTDGSIMLHNCTHYNCKTENIQQIPGLSALSEKISKAEKIPLTFSLYNGKNFFYCCFMSELNCFILVRQSSEHTSDSLYKALWINILLCVVVTAIAIIITNITLNFYQTRIERLSIFDSELKNINQSQQEEIRKNHKAMLEKTKSLERALADVKQLSGLLPICASCKKVRDGKGYWEQLESYISSHSSAEFSHGLCPDCAQKLYPEVFKEGCDYASLKVPPEEYQKIVRLDGDSSNSENPPQE